MIESFQTERQMTANALSAELLYMEQELAKIKERGDYKEYTALMRTYLATQKAFLMVSFSPRTKGEDIMTKTGAR